MKIHTIFVCTEIFRKQMRSLGNDLCVLPDHALCAASLRPRVVPENMGHTHTIPTHTFWKTRVVCDSTHRNTQPSLLPGGQREQKPGTWSSEFLLIHFKRRKTPTHFLMKFHWDSDITKKCYIPEQLAAFKTYFCCCCFPFKAFILFQ